MIANRLNNKKVNPIVTELFFRGRNVNISLVLLHNLKNKIRRNSTHYFIMKVLNK